MLHARPDYQRIQDPLPIEDPKRIPDDEPVFLLRGQDSIAAAVTRHWADLNDAAGGDPTLSARAREHADLMDDWPKKKRADF